MKKEIKTTKLKGIVDKRIVHLAGFREQKDHINLIECFKLLHDRDNEFTLHLIGKEYVSDYSTQIRKKIKELELDNFVFYYGMCRDVKYILSQATVGVLSSKSEGLPLSLIEYAICGLPFATTDVGATGKVIGNLDYAVPPKNPEALANALYVLLKDKDLRNKESLFLKKRAKAMFSVDAFMNKLKSIYLNEVRC